VAGAVREEEGEVEDIVMLGTGGREGEAKLHGLAPRPGVGSASSDSGILVWFVRTLYNAMRRRRRSVSACWSQGCGISMTHFNKTMRDLLI